jgi:hypothetical protein
VAARQARYQKERVEKAVKQDRIEARRRFRQRKSLIRARRKMSRRNK